MGYVGFFGCLLLAFAPAFSVFLLVLTKNAQLIILSIGGSFFWLLSALLASIWWFIIPPLRTVYPWVIVSSVLWQEGVRFGFLRLYEIAEKGFLAEEKEKERQTTRALTTHPDSLKASLAIGWGAGVAHSLVSYVTLLWEYAGPASYFSNNCSVNLFTISAIQSHSFILLHIFWSILSFESFKERNYIKIAIIVASHLAASFITMINVRTCGGGISAIVIITLIIACITAFQVRRSLVFNKR